jgi:hypothetical protein
MRTRWLALLAGLYLPLFFPSRVWLNAQTPEGSFVKAPVSIDFKEALTFPEISLMVRAGMAQAEIIQEVRLRGLVRPVTAEDANLLQENGAGTELVATLQDLRFVLSPAEFDNYLQRKARKQAEQDSQASSPAHSRRPPMAQTAPPAPAPGPKPVEIEVPMDEFTTVTVKGHTLRLYIHDNGDGTISLKVEDQRPTKFPKTNGFDSQDNNLTPLFAVNGAKVSFVNTARAHMNRCILRIDPN